MMDRLENHALDISQNFSETKEANSKQAIRKLLDESYKEIIKGYEYIDKDVRDKKEVIPASQWLLDNLYLIEKEYKDIKFKTPNFFYKRLPVLTKGELAGFPRVYQIAASIVAYTEGKICKGSIESFINAYQEITTLTSCELWALPIMLKVALIKNISIVTRQMAFAQKEKKIGDSIADELVIYSDDEERINKTLNSIDIENPLSSHFIERVLKTLRDNGCENPRIYKWFDEALDRQGDNAERMILIDHQKQGYFQLTLDNSISGIREISSISWSAFFEEFSFVEKLLRADPAGVYKKMDFDTRDYYRHKVECYSRKFKVSETYIAKQLLECAGNETEEHKRHIGYYLIDEGIACLKKEVNYKDKWVDIIRSHLRKNNATYYIFTIVLGTILLELLIMLSTYRNDSNVIIWKYIIAILVILIPCSEIVNAILNWSINNLIQRRFVPKMNLEDGIPDEDKTIVVIPTIIDSEKRAEELARHMETYYLANEDKNLYFAILGDYVDYKSEHKDNDEQIKNAALDAIHRLNKKYASIKEQRFFYLNRKRQYNEKEKLWLGWERKRGKLMEFLDLLKGNEKVSYNVISGNLSNLRKSKYIITLDADTQLPMDTAKRLIGAMSHVLNRPVMDKGGKQVLRGYGLMQPRINISAISANKTMFARIFSGDIGIDTYTMAISDVYHDSFGEGIFTGKGIFDIDTFHSILNDAFPENAILSHDLIEGSFVRCALVSDIACIDGYPAYYIASIKRLHRWVRGDWQLLPWIFKKSVLNGLSRWKMIDNLRRSLISPSLIILVMLSFQVLPLNNELWLAIAIIALITPLLFDVSEAIVAPIKGISLSGKISQGKNVIEQVFLIFLFLPYNGYIMLHAIITTLYRLFISKRNLLEWQTAADAEAKSGKTLKSYIQYMWQGSLIGLIIGILAFKHDIYAGAWAMPSVLLWIISPYVAYLISRDNLKETVEFSESERIFIRKVARKTYGYFEDFVGEETNYLAPDNYQEDPYVGVAPRTSPTNIGMGLTALISAHDLGYIDIFNFTNKFEKIIDTMENLEKYKGHFYNWYDTQNRKPLCPKYVSTVDSGNLLSYLWLIQSTFKDYLNKPILDSTLNEGLKDIMNLVEEELGSSLKNKDFFTNIKAGMDITEFNIITFRGALRKIADAVREIDNLVASENLESYWLQKLKNSLKEHRKALDNLFPWLETVEGDLPTYEKILEPLNNLGSSILLKDVPAASEKLIENLKKGKFNLKDKKTNSILMEGIEKGNRSITALMLSLKTLSSACRKFGNDMDFHMLFDKGRMLFSIGYNVEHDKLDNSFYDLLASESRATSFIAVAKGDVPQHHWFKLGRAITLMDGKRKGLVSWSGTMFEYMMPLLIMKSYPDTLLSNTYISVIEGQKDYGKKKTVPWGISESAFYYFDTLKNYQYKAHGVPGIGVKRGLRDELVISPYSTIMAMQLDLRSGLENLKELSKEGLEGKYGYYEAIDYTKERLPQGMNKAIVKNFMVHHQGMSLMALNNILNKNIFQERFHRIPRVRATELLLQERMPKQVVYDREVKLDTSEITIDKSNIILRKFSTPKTPQPEVVLLSNGFYSTMLTTSGSGYSKVQDMMLYRWREDMTINESGMFIYIKDVNENKFWSATYQPTKKEPDEYKVVFALDSAVFSRTDDKILTETKIAVSSEDNVEVREVFITNRSNKEKTIEVTSYSEVTLATYSADAVHPAFSNLFIGTEFDEELSCVYANRRARAKGQMVPWMMQNIIVEDKAHGMIQFETSRENFIGRNRDLSEPEAMVSDSKLKNSEGAVLDPIISLRRRIKLKPDESCKVYFVTATGCDKEEIVTLARKYKEVNHITNVFSLAKTHSDMELKYLGIKYPQANLYQFMASRILFLSDNLKDRENYIRGIKLGQQALWAYGISGDLPILLLKVYKIVDKGLVKQVLKVHEYWSMKGLKVDLIILDMEESSYAKTVATYIRDTIASSHVRERKNKPGGVFFYDRGMIPEQIIELLMGISRLVIDANNGLLINQIRFTEKPVELEKLPVLKEKKYNYQDTEIKLPKLEFYNEYGGFDEENNEYVISLKDGKKTPAPWINVISNESFGHHVSEIGVSYTWHKNSRENKLTPWNNDWIRDTPGEILYLRDEYTGDIWNINASPIRDEKQYLVRHGFGYSSFEHDHIGIYGKMTLFTPRGENLKIISVKLKNNSDEKRKISLTYYAQMVMGVIPEKTSGQIVTSLMDKCITAENPYSQSFNGLYTYLTIVGGSSLSYCGSRKEFLGREGKLKEPEALKYKNLSNKVGGGIDPCLSCQSKIEIEPSQEVELLVLLGEDDEKQKIESIIKKYSKVKKAEEALKEVKDFWIDLLQTIKVKTPDKAMDLMLNGWFMYQDIACRVWSRTAFYQSGGAYGFRDQLQDVMSLSYLRPEITRKQIEYSSTRQFLEGDVQHWWHPVVDSGIRTRFSDDLLWLPFVVADYIKNTGDYSVLDEMTPYLEDEPLSDGEDERYTISKVSEVSGSIYEHCLKAIERGLRLGEHNIPLMGSGDWNDGMSTVGNEGKGESVWLGWFLYSILKDFTKIAEFRGDGEKSNYFANSAEELRKNMEKHAWDGRWYRRAYFDDGTALGSIENDECQIDSLAQSWGVISGGASKTRAIEAMKSMEDRLVLEDKNMILLFTPPFDKSKLEPGYIKGYVKGVRENGGQYTHGSTWVILAYAMLGDQEKAYKAFNMLNPISHTRSHLDCQLYKVEPYVVVADVYSADGNYGRGGWSWYTGSAGWMYRAGIDGILGLKLNYGKGFKVEPCIPESWDGFEITYKKDGAVYHIKVERSESKAIILNDKPITEDFIPYQKPGEYKVKVYI
ncbi:glycosyltransferase 36 [Clostridium cellulovorans 743B]|uniref:Glycosyltransferase 36 n=3 Tax=Clostridium cellulovorans TaxID=1493 RepID=D9SRQ0_CLOC7|nr:glycosyltransferase 36 [Clostridium cellulovorans 743B]BAV13144.1 cellobiose phosphorylase [Clostridium cellulovorans]